MLDALVVAVVVGVTVAVEVGEVEVVGVVVGDIVPVVVGVVIVVGVDVSVDVGEDVAVVVVVAEVVAVVLGVVVGEVAVVAVVLGVVVGEDTLLRQSANRPSRNTWRPRLSAAATLWHDSRCSSSEADSSVKGPKRSPPKKGAHDGSDLGTAPKLVAASVLLIATRYWLQDDALARTCGLACPGPVIGLHWRPLSATPLGDGEHDANSLSISGSSAVHRI